MKKRLIGVILFSALLVGGSFFLNHKEDLLKFSSDDTLVVPSGELSFFEKDTDGDGLKDWEEELVGSDPLLFDSNGDGISDYEEFGGDLSSYSEDVYVDSQSIEASFFKKEGGTLTEAIAKTLFVSSLDAERKDLSSEEKVRIAENIFSETQQGEYTTYSREDLTINDGGKDALGAFGNAAAKTIFENQRIGAEEVLFLFERAALEGSALSRDTLKKQSDLYKKLTNELLLISTPQEMTSPFLSLINSYAKTGEALLQMSNISEDAILGIVGFEAYQEGLSETQTSFSLIVNVFKAKEITFTEEELGYIWETL